MYLGGCAFKQTHKSTHNYVQYVRANKVNILYVVLKIYFVFLLMCILCVYATCVWIFMEAKRGHQIPGSEPPDVVLRTELRFSARAVSIL